MPRPRAPFRSPPRLPPRPPANHPSPVSLAACLAAGARRARSPVIGVERRRPRPAARSGRSGLRAPVYAPVRAEVRAPVTRLVPAFEITAPRFRAPSRAGGRSVRADRASGRAPSGCARRSPQSARWDSKSRARRDRRAGSRRSRRTQAAVTLRERLDAPTALTGSASGVYDAYRGGDVEPRASGGRRHSRCAFDNFARTPR